MNTSTTVAQYLAERLKALGCQRLFGVPGGGSSLDVINAAREAGLDFVLTRREDAAMIMAGVSALLSQAPGLAVTTKGPQVSLMLPMALHRRPWIECRHYLYRKILIRPSSNI